VKSGAKWPPGTFLTIVYQRDAAKTESVRLQYEDFSALLHGDAQDSERRYWDGLVPDLVRDCTIIKLAHHGSRNATDTRWLELVSPVLATASEGKNDSIDR
jgi:competence protein ComEC